MKNYEDLLKHFGHKSKDEESLRFFQVPKVLFNNERYEGLSMEAKMAYGILRDRQELSRKNDWKDENGYLYFIYTNENLAEIFECSKNKVISIKKELEKYNLLVSRRMGLGKPNRLYILKPNYEKSDAYSDEKSYPQAQTIDIDKKSLIRTSRNAYKGFQEVPNKDTNDTEYSDTEFNDTHSFIQDNESKSNNENKEKTRKENEGLNEDRKELEDILNRLDLNDFKDSPVNNLAIKRAIEVLWYKESINSNGLTVTNKQIRNDLKFLTNDHLVNATNIFIKESERQEIKNRIGYLSVCIYNSIFDIDMSIHNQIHNS